MRMRVGVQVTPIWGWLNKWSGWGRGNGYIGCWRGAGSRDVSVIWLGSIWPRLSFPAGLSTLRARSKGGMPLIPVMPTCLKPLHLLPKTDTQPPTANQIRWSAYIAKQGPLALVRSTLPPCSCHPIFFSTSLTAHCCIFILNFFCSTFHNSAPDRALSLLFSDIITAHM